MFKIFYWMYSFFFLKKKKKIIYSVLIYKYNTLMKELPIQ